MTGTVVNQLPAKFSLSADRTTLTVVNVCRDCIDNTTDLQAIQCNASNKHGYAFAAGYLNVLRMISDDFVLCSFGSYTIVVTSLPPADGGSKLY